MSIKYIIVIDWVIFDTLYIFITDQHSCLIDKLCIKKFQMWSLVGIKCIMSNFSGMITHGISWYIMRAS